MLPFPLKTKEEVIKEIQRRIDHHVREGHVFYHFYDICQRGPESVYPEVEVVNHLPGKISTEENPPNEVILVNSNSNDMRDNIDYDTKLSFDTQPDLAKK